LLNRPHYRADQRGWFVRHPVLTVILVLIVLGISGGVAGETSMAQSKTGNSQENDNSKPKTQTGKLGEQVNWQDKTLTVNAVAPYTSGSRTLQPKSGNKFISIDVSLRNDSQEAFGYNVVDFTLHDDKDYEYPNAATDHEQYFTFGTLQPGQTTRGFITYEIPATNTPTEVVYTLDFIDLSQIIIKLTK
jgi:hypothetical protein